MDPEQTFLRVHARLSGMLSQLLTPRIRLALEYLYLSVAFLLFCLLVVMHTNFVQQPGCSSEFAGIELTETQLVQIKIVSGGLWTQSADNQNVVDFKKQGMYTESPEVPVINGDGFTVLTAKFWSNWIGSGARKSRLFFKSWKTDKEPLVDSIADSSIVKTLPDEVEIKDDAEKLHIGLLASLKESFKGTIIRYWEKLQNTAGRNALLDVSGFLPMIHTEHLKTFLVQCLEKRSKAFEPTYLYTVEKGFFLLPEGAKSRHNVRTLNVTISAQNSCFGNRWQQILINSFVGYDTILMNSLLSSPGQGYLYNFQTKEFYDLSYGHEAFEGRTGFGGFSYLAFSVTSAFMQHLILYFWNRFEVPALQRFLRSRAQLQQQGGVQITSSTIYTSTLHIARVNVRNPGVINNEVGGGPEIHVDHDIPAPDSLGPGESTVGQEHLTGNGNTDELNSPLQFPDLSPQRSGAASGSGVHNPFGSLLLWILGGAPSDGIVSFFSMFRDVRDQGQGYAEAAQHENEPVT